MNVLVIYCCIIIYSKLSGKKMTILLCSKLCKSGIGTRQSRGGFFGSQLRTLDCLVVTWRLELESLGDFVCLGPGQTWVADGVQLGLLNRAPLGDISSGLGMSQHGVRVVSQRKCLKTHLEHLIGGLSKRSRCKMRGLLWSSLGNHTVSIYCSIVWGTSKILRTAQKTE